MYTETTEYQYIKKLKAPKAWFKANAGAILSIYGAQHNIQKEEILLGKFLPSSEVSPAQFRCSCLVIGALQTPNYALFVSHKHPDGQASSTLFII